MSYSFDVLERAWETLRSQLPEDTRDGKLAIYFGFMIAELHEANHRLRDAVNKDPRVTADARRIDELLSGKGETQ